MTRPLGLAVVVTLMSAALSPAGHSRFPYCDGGQSADGRFTVTTELVVEPQPDKKSAAPDYYWKFTWTDTKTKSVQTGKLEGLTSGRNGVFDPTHAQVFVAPGGETFAVWNPNVLAPTPNKTRPPKDLTAAEARDFAGFTHRLTVYKNSGEVVKRLDLKDFLVDDDWKWLFCYGAQVYWQANFSGLTRDTAPRVGYALYQVSPDYTVLETLVGATTEAAGKAKANNVTPPAPRLVRVDLTTGKVLDAAEKLPESKTPVRPFKGGLTNRGESGQAGYVPSLDPVRVEGTFRTPK